MKETIDVHRAAVLHRLGVRLISFDRPGYGGSDRLEGRRVADVADDVLAIAAAYGVKRFSVVGRSGGGPHSLACGALLPERTARAAVLVGLAPHEAEGLDWYDGMAQSNVLEHTAATAGFDGISAHLSAAVDTIRANPASLLSSLQKDLPDLDRRVVADHGIRAMLVESYAEALRTSAYGWIDDALAFCSPWGFDPRRWSPFWCCSGTAPVTFSPRRATPPGWPGASRGQRWPSRPTLPTSAPSTCCLMCCAGCPPTGSAPDNSFYNGNAVLPVLPASATGWCWHDPY